jgi:hypothetical protein
MKWISMASGMNPKSNAVLFRRINGEFILAYRRYGKFYTQDGKNILDYGITLDVWMDIDNDISPFQNQPERSKREDSQECEMRCSEHCGNTVSPK